MVMSATKTLELNSETAQAALEKIIAARDIPGAGFAAMKDREIVAVAAAGVANLDTGHAVTDDTIWQAGSIGKTYTATLVMQLVEDGLLELDRPVLEYLPELRFADEEATRTVTTRNLLTHTAGIDGDKYDETGDLYGRGDDCLQRYVADLVDLPQIIEPGRIWSYCNAGYIVLGRLIQVLRGQSYEQVLKERVLDPAGLDDTKTYAGQVIQRNVSAGHMPGPEGKLVVAPIWELGRSVNPAGGTPYVTPENLVRFGQVFLNGGVAANGTRILSEASVREMQRPQVECPERELSGGHWGLGLMVKLGPGNAVYGHDGNTFGQTASLRFVPEANATFALVSNRLYANNALADLCEDIIDEWAGTVTVKRPQPVEGVPFDIDRLIGIYEHIGVEFHVRDVGGKLMMAIEVTRDTTGQIDSTPNELRPIDDNTFLVHLAEMNDDLQVAFLEPDSAGRPGYMHFGGRISRRRS